MARTLSISLLALSLLAALGVAGAQGADAFAFTDASLDTMPPASAAYADLVAGRVELADERTVRATMELAALPELQPGIAYLVVFTAGERAFYAALATVPTTSYVYGQWGGQGPDTMEEASGSYTIGPAGVITVDVPVSVFQADRLHSLQAYTVDVKADVLPVGLPTGGFVVLDEAVGEGELVLREPQAEGSVAGAPDEADPSSAPASTSASTPDAGQDAAPAATTRDDAKTVPTPASLLVIGALAIIAWARR